MTTPNSQSTSGHYYIRHGVQGEIGRFRSLDGSVYRRGQQVICQTTRGLVVGDVLSTTSAEQATNNLVLRLMTPQDHLLQQRLMRYKSDAIDECRSRMNALGVEAQLLDVDHLFDGRTLLFYFLGEIPDELTSLTDELAAEYERKSHSSEFADLLMKGCGPGCGTTEKSGCGTSGGCAVCVAASVCRK